MKRLALLLIPPALLASGLFVCSQAPDGDAADAWSACRRGNELLTQARHSAEPDPGLLARAADEYRACLRQEATTPGASALFDGARYNLELTRLLLAQAGRQDKKDNASSQPQAGQSPQSDKAGGQEASGDPKAAAAAASSWNDRPAREKGQSGGASSPKDASGEKQPQDRSGAGPNSLARQDKCPTCGADKSKPSPNCPT
jgi:hypothetical protein